MVLNSGIPSFRLYALSVAAIVFASFSALAQELNRTDANGNKQGTWKKMHSNGKVRYEGQFENDKPIGLFKYYYNTGKLQATNNHLKDGSVANHVYHQNGKIKAKGMYRNTKKDSLWQYFNNAEQLVLEESYDQDVLHGAQRKFFGNAQMGEETSFNQGVKHGKWLKFFEDGKKWLEANYKDGNLDGSFKMYNEKGKPKLQGNYSNGIRVGRWLDFNDNGSVRTQDSYVNGVLKSQKFENGEFTEYYDNEIPKSVYNYKKGMKNGEFKEFFEAGEWVREEIPGKMGGPDEIQERLEGTKMKVKGWYLNDQLNGKVTYFKEDGGTDRIEVWENGELVSTINWDGKGNE